MAVKHIHRNTKTYRTTRRARRIRSVLDVTMKLSLLFIAAVCLTVVAFQTRQFLRRDTGKQFIAQAASMLPGSGDSSGAASGAAASKFFAKSHGLPSRTTGPAAGFKPSLQNLMAKGSPSEAGPDGDAQPAADTQPMIAFTFDDGPYAPVDSRILNVLEAHGGRATFFVVGNRVNDYQSDLKRITELGSEVGNHTFEHKNLEKLDPAAMSFQIESTNDAVEAITGIRPRLVRVPYGAFKGQVTTQAGHPLIQWNVDTEDWKSKDKDQVVQSILANAADGNIILMHDLYESTAEAFEEAVPLLVEQGFKLVTVSELYEARGVSLDPGNVYFGRP